MPCHLERGQVRQTFVSFAALSLHWTAWHCYVSTPGLANTFCTAIFSAEQEINLTRLDCTGSQVTRTHAAGGTRLTCALQSLAWRSRSKSDKAEWRVPSPPYLCCFLHVRASSISVHDCIAFFSEEEEEELPAIFRIALDQEHNTLRSELAVDEAGRLLNLVKEKN
jgi:hypothetical protein